VSMPIRRMAGLRTSIIRSFAASAPPHNVSLALGEPGWPLPDAAREALGDFADEADRCSYGPNQGIPELLSALLDYTNGQPHCASGGSGGSGGSAKPRPLEAENLMVTSGSQAALFAIFIAHVETGDVVAVPDPGFPVYRTLSTLAGGRTLTYPLAADGSLDPPALMTALDRHTRDGGAPVRLLVLNHPSNPTGGGATLADLDDVASACAERGILIVSDEAYRELYTDTPQPSLTEVTDVAIVTTSVSKAWAAPGLRVGWAQGPADLLAPARLVHNAMTTAPARPSQLAAAALLRDSPRVLGQSRAELAARWGLVEQHAPDWVRAAARPAGGFYLWVPIPAEAAGEDHAAWVAGLRDHGGVSVIPGAAFGRGGERHIRVSVGGPEDELVEGLRRMSAYSTGGES